MLFQNNDGTHTAGPLDVLAILHDVERGTYHAAFFEESPMPGPIKHVSELEVVRLRSKMHHTGGAPDLAGAQAHLDELAKRIRVPETNVARQKAFAWDGSHGVSIVIENWRREAGRSVADVVR